jgi:hypothetical protein
VLQGGERARNEADAEGTAGHALKIQRGELNANGDPESRDGQVVRP